MNFWDGEFQINEPATGDKDFTNTAVTTLADGRILVTWGGAFETGDGDPSNFGHGVRGRILNADGSPAGDEFVINTTTFQEQWGASATSLSDGRFVVTWISNENGDGGTVDSDTCIRARVFESDGTPALYNGSTSDFVVNNVPGFSQYAAVVAPLADGGFAIAFSGSTVESMWTGHDVEVRRFTDDGPAAAEEMVSTPNVHSTNSTIASLNGGAQYVVGWQDAATNDLHARVFNANGTPVSNGFTIGTTTVGMQSQIHFAELADGRFVAAWSTENYGGSVGGDDGNSVGIRATVYNADGTPDMSVNGGADFIVNTTTHLDQRRSNIIGLDDGGFIVTFWSRQDPDDLDNNEPRQMILGQRYDADGVKVGDEFVANRGPGTSYGAEAGWPHSMTLMPDGRVFIMYNNEEGHIPNIVTGTFFDLNDDAVTLTGDEDTDQLVGSYLADTLDGAGGADTLYGGGGGDSLSGGEGEDQLMGGSGNDTLDGDADADIILGGAGDDTIDGGEGEDRVVFTGNFADYTITMGAGSVLTIVDNRTDDENDGTDTVSAAEILVFADGAVDAPANEAPTGIEIAGQAIAENAAVGTAVGVLSATDPDEDAISWTLEDASGLFELQTNEGVTSLVLSGELDFETTESYIITVTASDGELETEQEFVISVGDVVDILTGDSAVNTLIGAKGEDEISGLGGNDKLVGLDGDDLLIGGKGKEKLYGGAGLDTFAFATGDSGKKAKADTIYDFSRAEGDLIDLTDWDANIKQGGIQDFDFIGKAKFHGKAGELHFIKEKSDTWIEGDTNGNKKADFVIRLDDAMKLTADDFVLLDL